MRPVTIDHLDIKNHERYAQDQVHLDSKYITESISMGSYSEILGTSSIYTSNWETLFDLQIRNIPWANFSPPLKYNLQSNRFFSYQILPTIYVDADEEKDQEKEILDDKEEEEKEKKRESKRQEFIKKITNAMKGSKQTLTDFENDKSAIINLLESIKELDRILGQINSRKRQYQKG
jgi:hypothetical protein